MYNKSFVKVTSFVDEWFVVCGYADYEQFQFDLVDKLRKTWCVLATS